jgi:RNA polymerase sigma-70 factor (ECF subfamily)
MVDGEEPADAELLKQAQRGSREAFGRLVRRYQKRVYALCFRLGGSHDVADDLTQEAFIKAYQAVARFDHRYSFWSWISTIATNNAINYLKRRKFQLNGEGSEAVLEREEATSEGSNPHQTLAQKEIDQRYQEAVAALPAEFRAVFVLRMHEDKSYKEIAGMLGTTIGTVMSRLHRARQRLADALKDLLEP